MICERGVYRICDNIFTIVIWSDCNSRLVIRCLHRCYQMSIHDFFIISHCKASFCVTLKLIAVPNVIDLPSISNQYVTVIGIPWFQWSWGDRLKGNWTISEVVGLCMNQSQGGELECQEEIEVHLNIYIRKRKLAHFNFISKRKNIIKNICRR